MRRKARALTRTTPVVGQSGALPTTGDGAETINRVPISELQQELRDAWDKRRRPVIVFPDRESKLAWLEVGARTGAVPPLPEGAYYA